MLNIERVDYIMQELREKRTVYVKDLAERYFVSPSTIRRDLNSLEKEGLVRRTYGGAMLVQHESSEIPFFVRQNENKQEKNVMGMLACQLVRNDQFIFLDSTSTVAHMVKYLRGKESLKVLTTSAEIALDCLDSLSAQVYCTGGWMSSFSRGFVGEAARKRIAEFRPDLLFFSARSLSLEDGITDVNEEDVYMKQQMLRSCREVVFLCDKTKFDKTSYRIICDICKIDYLVTNEKPSELWLRRLADSGVKLIYPDAEKVKMIENQKKRACDAYGASAYEVGKG